MSIRRAFLFFAAFLLLSWSATASAEQFANITEAFASHTGVPGPEAQGDILETFTNPDTTCIGLTIDHMETGQMVYFCEDTVNALFLVDVTMGAHTVTPLPVSGKLGGNNLDGGAVRPSDGYIYGADYQGDLAAIDDNVYLFDRTGAAVAFWETDGGLAGTQCAGVAINGIIDVAVGAPGTLYATGAGDNNIYSIDVSNTSGGTATPSPCTIAVVATAPAPIVNVLGIGYDPQNDGYWLSDFSSTALVLVANDGTFNTVLESFSASAGTYNSGVSIQTDGGPPIPLWAMDFDSDSTAIIDSGTVPVELQSLSVE